MPPLLPRNSKNSDERETQLHTFVKPPFHLTIETAHWDMKAQLEMAARASLPRFAVFSERTHFGKQMLKPSNLRFEFAI